MSDMKWLSIHFYPSETHDVFLARAVKPFLEQYIWPEKSTRAFFIRYQDEKGPHIRLRMRGEVEWLDDMLLPAFEGWMRDRGTWELVTYQPEPSRFGGEEPLAWAEEHFHVSTRVVLDRIAKDQFTYGDAMFDALRLLTAMSAAAGFSREKARWYFGALFNMWLPSFFGVEEPADKEAIQASFQQNLAAQQHMITQVLDRFWNDIEKGKFDAKQPEWLRWYKGNELIMKGLGDKLEIALPSLIHLTNNRIGINNQDEVYLNYILSTTL
ncbi:MAG: thiopeptide-type bacteriocin biosynthesis protein [Saprospiraceae bacterium]|nr:thiopeptide-type bacteriocin biosynthesis protein [Saprospiraceae bacterium]